MVDDEDVMDVGMARAIIWCQRTNADASWHCQYVRAYTNPRARPFFPAHLQNRHCCATGCMTQENDQDTRALSNEPATEHSRPAEVWDEQRDLMDDDAAEPMNVEPVPPQNDDSMDDVDATLAEAQIESADPDAIIEDVIDHIDSSGDREAIECADDRGDDVPAERAEANDPAVRGMLCFMKWWYLRWVEISVHGELLKGVPAFMQEDTLRIFGDRYSYIVPMHNIDYIRTSDGLQSIDAQLDDCGT